VAQPPSRVPHSCPRTWGMGGIEGAHPTTTTTQGTLEGARLQPCHKPPRRRRYRSAEGRSEGEAQRPTCLPPRATSPSTPAARAGPCQPPTHPQNPQNPRPHCRFIFPKLGIVTPTTRYNRTSPKQPKAPSQAFRPRSRPNPSACRTLPPKFLV
jgi:hypothetical protein